LEDDANMAQSPTETGPQRGKKKTSRRFLAAARIASHASGAGSGERRRQGRKERASTAALARALPLGPLPLALRRCASVTCAGATAPNPTLAAGTRRPGPGGRRHGLAPACCLCLSLEG